MIDWAKHAELTVIDRVHLPDRVAMARSINTDDNDKFSNIPFTILRDEDERLQFGFVLLSVFN